jgi:cell division protein FtsI (penicillin-binding protein 3)
VRPGSSLNRLGALFVVMMLLLAGIVVRLAFLQVRDQTQYEQLGADQRTRTIALPADRGQILDRDLTPLAITQSARDIYANPRYVTDPAGEALQIAPILGLRPKDVRAALTSDGTFVFIDRQVDTDVAQQVEDLELPGVGFLPVPKRYYPSGALAPQVLGFVGVDGDGLAGLESQYNTVLSGIPGQRTQEFSPGGLPISTATDTLKAPVPGADLVTTIDRQMQYEVQTALARAVKANGAKGGTVVVIDPHNGDVYAMATSPGFNPNDFAQTNPELWRNRPVTDMFEPGSVNKIITAAAALETGAVSVTRTFHVPSTLQVGNFLIHDSESHPLEAMTLGDIITHSSNVGATLVANKVGNDAMQQYMDRFGYGHTTGLGFPGEAAGKVPTVWDDVIRAGAAYGQGVSVTPLQMADVYATIANGGVWVQPRLSRGTVAPSGALNDAPGGTLIDAPPSPTRRVVRTDTAAMLTRMLAEVVQDGTGIEAQIPGYQVAGKTGTARKVDAAGHYIDRYVASFVGFLPAGSPRLVIAVSLDEPSTVFGGVAAAPLFSEIARYAIQRLGIAAAPPVALPPSALPAP